LAQDDARLDMDRIGKGNNLDEPQDKQINVGGNIPVSDGDVGTDVGVDSGVPSQEDIANDISGGIVIENTDSPTTAPTMATTTVPTTIAATAAEGEELLDGLVDEEEIADDLLGGVNADTNTTIDDTSTTTTTSNTTEDIIDDLLGGILADELAFLTNGTSGFNDTNITETLAPTMEPWPWELIESWVGRSETEIVPRELVSVEVSGMLPGEYRFIVYDGGRDGFCCDRIKGQGWLTLVGPRARDKQVTLLQEIDVATMGAKREYRFLMDEEGYIDQMKEFIP